jgi:hypothetical protein
LKSPARRGGRVSDPWIGTERTFAPQIFDVGGRGAVGRRTNAKEFALVEPEIAELGSTDSNGILQHGCKYRLKIARRAADSLEHLCGCGLLLQRFRKFACALLLCLEQPCVLNSDDCLVSEGFDQLDLLLGERPYRSAVQEKNANRYPAA